MVDKEKYVRRFADLYKEKTGQDLSDAEALDLFEKLVTLVNAIYTPLPRKYER